MAVEDRMVERMSSAWVDVEGVKDASMWPEEERPRMSVSVWERDIERSFSRI